MKLDLTYEQCRDLEKWGLDQTLREGDWIWWGEKTTRLIESYVMSQKYMNKAPGAWVKLPSAEEMREFLGGVLTGLTWRVDEWLADGVVHGFSKWGTGKTFTQALYALAEKIYDEQS